MKNEIWLSIIIIILIAIIIWGLFYIKGADERKRKLVERNSQINRYLIFLAEGERRSAEELKNIRDRESARLDRERNIKEREERLDNRERARLDRDRESLRLISETGGNSEKSLAIIERAAKRIGEILAEVKRVQSN